MPRTTAFVPLLALTALAASGLGLAPRVAMTTPQASLTQITPKNVTRLAGAWLDHLEGGATDRTQEGTPVASGGRLYAQTSQGDVFAALGHEHVVALSQQTGARLWLAQVGTPGQDTAANGASTPWTMYAGGLVFTGTENGAYTATGGDNLWAFRLGGKIGQASAGPAIPARQPVTGVTVAGASVTDTVVLGRDWDAGTNAPGPTEDLASQTAMALEIMTVPAGTTVTFSNPAGNSKQHCAEAFFDPEFFKIGPLAPGQSGTYFYNDCAGFPWNTGEIVVR